MSKDDILNKLLTNAIEITNPDTEHYIPVWWVKQVINDLNLNSLNISNEFESYITQIKDHFNNETNIIFSDPKIIDDVQACDVTFKKNNITVIIDEFKRYHIINDDELIRPNNNQYDKDDTIILILKYYLNKTDE